ncbi:hypothetical protein AAMO2058_001602200 [Amorphochlora amoebiformis]
MSHSIIDRDIGPDPDYKPPPKGAYRGKYKECYEFYDRYNKCHKEKRFSRYLGACSSFKAAMDNCNQAALKKRRKESTAKYRAKGLLPPRQEH